MTKRKGPRERGPSASDHLGGDRAEDTKPAVALPIEIRSIQKNADETLKVSLEEFRGHRLVDVRIFARFTMANALMPTKKGVSLRLEQLPELVDALRQAYETARKLGLFGA